MSKTSLIIPAAGSGKRMGGDTSKQYLTIGDRPILAETLLVFQSSAHIDEIILVSPASEIDFSREIVDRFGLGKVSKIVAGGTERQDSIKNGLDVLGSSSDVVVIHDAVRPFINDITIARVINLAREHGAAIVAVPVKDTVKEVNNGTINRTLPRENLWLAQTPQAFRYKVIKEANDFAATKGIRGTDDASLVEAMGLDVKIVMGSYENIKITTPEDLVFAEAIIKERNK